MPMCMQHKLLAMTSCFLCRTPGTGGQPSRKHGWCQLGGQWHTVETEQLAFLLHHPERRTRSWNSRNEVYTWSHRASTGPFVWACYCREPMEKPISLGWCWLPNHRSSHCICLAAPLKV
ncbi:hypothetical protein Pelo_232 [Pelomyxa schiedti]|nr:hypothetical protein Pelo_232 [Pelomyxa schiedti]